MPYVFHRPQDDYRVDDWDWNFALQLAQRYGWIPSDACDSAEKAVSVYKLKNSQWVTDYDASNLASAIEQALNDIPDVEREENVEISGLPDNPLEWFSGEGKQFLRELVFYLRRGGFHIC
ncbi:MAG: hypothetical protein KatS3mg105_4492 [Gemmatales bacterium]|nr:MAG: hypothetical protein KatS3mg105_4492 [Gemmatales bacterium]